MRTLPTEPIGSIPRPAELIKAIHLHRTGGLSAEALEEAYEAAVEETIRKFEQTGSPIITDGEQRKSSFATYPLEGTLNLAPDGLVVEFSDGHARTLPRLIEGPFRYRRFAAEYVRKAKRFSSLPFKQAVISASFLAMLYPRRGIADYPREAFLDDVVGEAAQDIRRCFREGASVGQIDLTEALLALKLDPSGNLLREFVALNNRVIRELAESERQNLGVHICRGADQDALHSPEVDYGRIFPEVFELNVPRFYFALCGEKDVERSLKLLGKYATGNRLIFVGVTDPNAKVAETPQVVRERILEAARYIDPAHLGTTDDCGFSPFGDDLFNFQGCGVCQGPSKSGRNLPGEPNVNPLSDTTRHGNDQEQERWWQKSSNGSRD